MLRGSWLWGTVEQSTYTGGEFCPPGFAVTEEAGPAGEAAPTRKGGIGVAHGLDGDLHGAVGAVLERLLVEEVRRVQ